MPCCSALMPVSTPPSCPGWWVYLPHRCSAHALLLLPHASEHPSLPSWVVSVFTSHPVFRPRPAVPHMWVSTPPSCPGWWVYLPLTQCSTHILLPRPHAGKHPHPPALGGGCIYLSPSIPPMPCCPALMQVSIPTLLPWVVGVFTSCPVFRPCPAALPSCG